MRQRQFLWAGCSDTSAAAARELQFRREAIGLTAELQARHCVPVVSLLPAPSIISFHVRQLGKAGPDGARWRCLLLLSGSWDCLSALVAAPAPLIATLDPVESTPGAAGDAAGGGAAGRGGAPQRAAAAAAGVGPHPPAGCRRHRAVTTNQSQPPPPPPNLPSPAHWRIRRCLSRSGPLHRRGMQGSLDRPRAPLPCSHLQFCAPQE